MKRWFLIALALLFVGLPGQYSEVCGQAFRRAGTEFNAKRAVRVPPGKNFSVIVTEFYHHGEIGPEGRNLVVATGREGKIVPSRILQLGPGDFCRLAIQTTGGQSEYEIFYGGEPPTADMVPQWTNRDGLLMETRHYKDCNLNSLDSVREAFRSARPIGSDYVPAVQHSGNPFAVAPGAFLSRYTGTLRVPRAGEYHFWTSSEDCSFVLIDGNVVTEAPGRHRPLYQARPGTGNTVRLEAGEHKWEYYHAAAGPSAVMVAAWLPGRPGEKPKPQAIPGSAFRVEAIGRAEAGPPTLRTRKLSPDFTFKVFGDVPLPDNPMPLIGVLFKNNSPPAISYKAKILWDFGDGQTSDQPNPAHVFLRPGLYKVTLAVKRGTRTLEITNRVFIAQPTYFRPDKKKLHTLDDYLPVLANYDAGKLDAMSLRQLVLTYLWKSDQTLIPESESADEKDDKKEKAPEKPKTSDQLLQEAQTRQAEALGYLREAVDVGKTAFREDATAKGDNPLHELAFLIGPVARNRLGEAELAFSIWTGAAKKISDAPLKADCEIRAASIALLDQLDPGKARILLDAATKLLGKDERNTRIQSRLARTWGDYHAMTGNGKAAREAYAKAEQLRGFTRQENEQTAWRGAHGRTAEEFIRAGRWGRAREAIALWQEEFPAEKLEGYLHLQFARYWAGREMHAQAISQAEQLIAVNPASPYADRLLQLAAESEIARGKLDRAKATLESLLKDYPGSPLVPEVKKLLGQLASGEVSKPKPRALLRRRP